MFRMPRFVFRNLLSILTTRGLLQDSRLVQADEQLCMFLYFAGHRATNANLQERFQRAGDTITYYIYRVVRAIKNMASEYIKLPGQNCVHDLIAKNPKYFPFFPKCRMAIDGTHVPVHVPAKLMQPFTVEKD